MQRTALLSTVHVTVVAYLSSLYLLDVAYYNDLECNVQTKRVLRDFIICGEIVLNVLLNFSNTCNSLH